MGRKGRLPRHRHRPLRPGPARRKRPQPSFQGGGPGEGPVLLPGAARSAPAGAGRLPAGRVDQDPGPRPCGRARNRPGCRGGEPGCLLCAHGGLRGIHRPGAIPSGADRGHARSRHRGAPGLHRFTVGQRRGINRPAASPYYVVRLDRERNRLVVGTKADLLASACRVVAINWIAPPPGGPVRLATRVRYRTREAPSTVNPIDSSSAVVRFDAPQSAVTPGQAAVFYDGAEVLGGGFIAPGEVGSA
ncbi:MAG: hypothetical protein EHM15_05955 [Desulfobacteraceae bacterium]|nr:MAG: hypothetical protein EHM15_05955 [Desulfobacteraceae bacterium]